MKDSDFDQSVGAGESMADFEDIRKNILEVEKDDPESAMKIVVEALESARSNGSGDEEIRLLVDKGRIHRKLAQYVEAIDCLTTAALLAEQTGIPKLIRMSNNSLGILYRQIADFENALTVYNKMINYTDGENEPEYLALLLNNIGVVYRHLEERDKSLSYYMRALALYELAKDEKGYANTLNNMGLIYVDLNSYDQGIEYFERSLAIRRKIEDSPGVAVSLHNLGLAYCRKGDYAGSEKNFLKALAMFEEVGNLLGVAKTNEALGETYEHWPDLEKSESHLMAALSTAIEIDNEEIMKGSYEKISYLHEIRGDYKKALDYYKRFCSEQIKLSDRLKNDMCERVSIKSEIEKKKAEQKLYRMMNDELKKANKLISRKNRELKEFSLRLKELADTDQLTGLANRRFATERLKQEQVRHERNKKPFSVILADIDDFKHFNDEYGHECGDRILAHISAMFKGLVRKQDTVSRWGGEEFLFILPETDGKGCRKTAEKILQAVSESRIDYDGISITMTITMGYGVYDGKGDIGAVIDEADRAMYKGKKSGKNMVCEA